MRINLPHKFDVRPYQRKIYDAFFLRKIKRIIAVWHRRAGKDKTFLNMMIAAAMMRVGNYIYLFPKHNQARRNIWMAIDKDGQKFLDHFPAALITGNLDNKEMTIKLINGSTFQLLGSDRYDAIRGSNPVGIVNSEYGDHHPFAWEVTKPILIENEGWAVFQGTPKGLNHFFELYEKHQQDEDWFCQKLTIDDTKDRQGKPILSKEHVEKEYKDQDKEWLKQEFYCSFDAANAGAYYAANLQKAVEENRIKDFKINPKYVVNTFWDLGVGDATAIWFMQLIKNQLYLINYYEDVGEGLEHYALYFQKFEKKYRIKYGHHFAPFDINVKEWGTGKTRIQQARGWGINFRAVQKTGIDDGIQQVRKIFKRFVFHKTNCDLGIRCLKEYSKKYNEELKCFMNKPTHNWSSHAADALRYLAIAWEDHYAISDNRETKNMNEIEIF